MVEEAGQWWYAKKKKKKLQYVNTSDTLLLTPKDDPEQKTMFKSEIFLDIPLLKEFVVESRICGLKNGFSRL